MKRKKMKLVRAWVQREKDAELADLRAYKERTEAGLGELCRRAGNSPTDYEFLTPDDLRDAGLWRDPPQAEVQP